jgi:uroporphyrinogen-III synthase
MSLFKKHIVITRALNQCQNFSEKLKTQTAIPLLYPCIQIKLPQNTIELDLAVEQLEKNYFDWLVLTSQNVAYALSLKAKKLPAALKIAVVGPSTAQTVLSLFNKKPNCIPEQFDANSLAQLFYSQTDQKIFLPQSNLADSNFKNQLITLGNQVTTPIAYQTMKGTGGIRLLENIKKKQIDAITFVSPSAVRYFIERLREEGGDLNALAGICIACMGHVTKKAAQENEFEVDVCPTQHTLDGLIQAMSEYFS